MSRGLIDDLPARARRLLGFVGKNVGESSEMIASSPDNDEPAMGTGWGTLDTPAGGSLFNFAALPCLEP